MYFTKKSVLGILIAIFLIVLSITLPAHAGQDGFAVKDGHDVIQTISGKIYVGTGVAFNGNWVTLFNVEFPKNTDGTGIGAVTFPGQQVTLLYHQGSINQPAQQ